jgi:hypothetical protein
LSGFFASLLDLCRFRRGPEDMPYAPRLLVALLIACGGLQLAFRLHNGVKPVLAVAALAGGLVMLGAIFALVRGRGHPERFVQTATALAGVYLLFGIVANVVALWLPMKTLRAELLAHPGHAPMLSGAEMLLVLAVFALGVWQLCVWIRILRRAMDVSLAGAVLAFLLLVLIDWIVTGVAAVALGAV